MAPGVISYCNGESGWIKQSNVSDQSTAIANDVLFEYKDVVSGTVALGSAVSFTIGDYRAGKNITVS